jgi:hypothetical protein
MDFAMGPNQGQGVPAPYDHDGKAWDLAVQETRFAANVTRFDGTLKGWGTGPLEAAVLAGSPIGGNAKVLAVSTLEDVTDMVTVDGQLTIELPEPTKYNYILFSIYLIHSNFMAQNSPPLMLGPQTTPETWVQNGSWAVDHFSARGAKLAAQFWEEHILTDGVLDLVKEVGNYAVSSTHEHCVTLVGYSFIFLFPSDYCHPSIHVFPILLAGNPKRKKIFEGNFLTYYITVGGQH